MIYLDDGFFDHRKVIAAGDDAAILYLKLLGWLKQQRSDDGRIPAYVVPRHPVIIGGKALAQDRLVAALVQHGLWVVDGDDYLCHGYAERNEKAIRKSKQAATAARKRHADAGASAVRTQERPQGGDDADAGAYIHKPQPHPQPQPQPQPPVVDKSSSSTESVGRPEAPRSPTLDAARLHAMRAFKAQPAGSVRVPDSWRQAAMTGWLSEHVDECSQLTRERPDLDGPGLLALIDRPTTNPGYRIQPAVDLPTITDEDRAATKATRDGLRESIPTAVKREAS